MSDTDLLPTAATDANVRHLLDADAVGRPGTTGRTRADAQALRAIIINDAG